MKHVLKIVLVYARNCFERTFQIEIAQLEQQMQAGGEEGAGSVPISLIVHLLHIKSTKSNLA